MLFARGLSVSACVSRHASALMLLMPLDFTFFFELFALRQLEISMRAWLTFVRSINLMSRIIEHSPFDYDRVLLLKMWLHDLDTCWMGNRWAYIRYGIANFIESRYLQA